MKNNVYYILSDFGCMKCEINFKRKKKQENKKVNILVSVSIQRQIPTRQPQD